MCRMLGVVFKGSFPLDRLEDLRRLSEIGKIPGYDELGHRDGWGIVSFRDGNPRYIGRSPRPAFLDPSFDSAEEAVPDIVAPNIVLAHVRAASKGTATLPNTHPFIVGQLVLGHNGTLEDFFPETSRKAKGETDSERLALLVADRFEEKGDLGDAMKSVIRGELSEHEFSSAIMLASDGRRLFGYRDFSKEGMADYYDLRVCKNADYVALYQQTLHECGGSESRVKKGELVTVALNLDIVREMVL
jgi:predicted glutamine amidotransferase